MRTNPLLAVPLALSLACQAAPNAAVDGAIAIARGAPMTVDLIDFAEIDAAIDGMSEDEVERWVDTLPDLDPVSMDPWIFDMAPSEDPLVPGLTADGVAMRQGQTELVFTHLVSGVRQSVPLVVATANGFELRGGSIWQHDSVEAELVEAELDGVPRVLVGGVAAFSVQLYRDTLPLIGKDIVEVEAHSAIEVQVDATSAGHDVLMVIPRAAGLHTIELFADGEPIGEVSIEGVAMDDIVGLALAATPLWDSIDEDTGVVELGMGLRATLVDRFGESVLGVEPEIAWTVDGETDKRTGPEFHYIFDEDAELLVEANYGDHVISEVLPASLGWVAGGGALGPLSGLFVLGVLGLAMTERRPWS